MGRGPTFESETIVTISDRIGSTKDLVCVYFILIPRIVQLSYKTYAYIVVREKREMEENHEEKRRQ